MHLNPSYLQRPPEEENHGEVKTPQNNGSDE